VILAIVEINRSISHIKYSIHTRVELNKYLKQFVEIKYNLQKINQKKRSNLKKKRTSNSVYELEKVKEIERNSMNSSALFDSNAGFLDGNSALTPKHLEKNKEWKQRRFKPLPKSSTGEITPTPSRRSKIKINDLIQFN
jgi:hypothetical protein